MSFSLLCLALCVLVELAHLFDVLTRLILLRFCVPITEAAGSGAGRTEDCAADQLPPELVDLLTQAAGKVEAAEDEAIIKAELLMTGDDRFSQLQAALGVSTGWAQEKGKTKAFSLQIGSAAELGPAFARFPWQGDEVVVASLATVEGPRFRTAYTATVDLDLTRPLRVVFSTLKGDKRKVTLRVPVETKKVWSQGLV